MRRSGARGALRPRPAGPGGTGRPRSSPGPGSAARGSARGPSAAELARWPRSTGALWSAPPDNSLPHFIPVILVTCFYKAALKKKKNFKCVFNCIFHERKYFIQHWLTPPPPRPLLQAYAVLLFYYLELLAGLKFTLRFYRVF